MRRYMYHTYMYPANTAPMGALCVGSCMRINRLPVELRSKLFADGVVCVPTMLINLSDINYGLTK